MFFFSCFCLFEIFAFIIGKYCRFFSFFFFTLVYYFYDFAYCLIKLLFIMQKVLYSFHFIIHLLFQASFQFCTKLQEAKVSEMNFLFFFFLFTIPILSWPLFSSLWVYHANAFLIHLHFIHCG